MEPEAKEIVRKQMLQRRMEERKRLLRERHKKHSYMMHVQEGKAKEILKEKGRKKKRIIKAALYLFNKYGLENITVEDITLKANVGKGTFYSFFKTKGDVLVHYMNSELNRSIEEFELQFSPSKPFLSQIELLFSSFMKHLFSNKHLAMIMFKERFIAWGKGNENELKVEKALEKIVENSKNRKEIDVRIDTKFLAQMLHGICTMYMTFWLNGALESKTALFSQIKNAITVIMNGVSSKHDYNNYEQPAFNVHSP
jgi:AcrR family transcriptional regulator